MREIRAAEKFCGANKIRAELKIRGEQTAMRSGLCEPATSRILSGHKESGGHAEIQAALFIELLRGV